jgi:hypothetical protein
MRAFADWLIDQGDPRGDQVSRWLAAGAADAHVFWRPFGLTPEHAAYLKKFAETRRMKRDARKVQSLPDPIREAVGLPLGKEGGYFVGAQGFMGQDADDSVLNYNTPPAGQPGLWCQWEPNEDGTAIVWNQAEKFYDYIRWLEYLIKHFLAPWGYVLDGEVEWQGEEDEDRGTIQVVQNEVKIRPKFL